jgi:uncharacterized protein
MKPFAVTPELKVGTVVEVAGDEIRIEIDSTVSELTRTHAGNIYPVGQCGSIIKLHAGRKVLFAYVRVLRMRSEIAFQQGLPQPAPGNDARMIEANLFAEGKWNSTSSRLKLERGVTTYPLPGQSAYLTTLDELRALYGPDGAAGQKYRVELGSYVGANESACFADLDKLFGLHCAVLGSTGSGKSGTVAAILHSLANVTRVSDGEKVALRPRIVVIDPHGEYATAFSPHAVVFRAYSSAASETAAGYRQLKLPYWLMSGEEFRDLIIAKTEWEATSENNVLLKALRHARLVEKGLIEPTRDNWANAAASASELPESDRPTPTGKKQLEAIATYDRDTPDRFSLEEFRRHIDLEQSMRIKTGKWERLSPSEFKSHASILDKLSVLESDPRLNFMMQDLNSDTFDLAEILQQFVGELPVDQDQKPATPVDLRIVDISGLPNEIAGPLTAAIARLLFQYKVWQLRSEREKDPVLLVCEEAHRYVPDAGLAEYASAQKAIRRIAKEGRKYGLGMMLVSQRPADVEGTVLSQCNSWLVMRLTNSTDQQHVKRFLPDNLTGLANLLPSLSRQEAIFVGDAAALPARIRIRDLEKAQLPKSDDVSFGDGWTNAPPSIDEIRIVADRWRRTSKVASGDKPETKKSKKVT